MGLMASFLPGGRSGPAAKLPVVVLCRLPPDLASLQGLHDELAAALGEAGIGFLTADSFYDQPLESEGMLALRALAGDLLVLGWHYPRALKWILARHDLEVNGATRRLHCLDVRDLKPAATVAKVKEILAGKASAEVKPAAEAKGIGQRPPATGTLDARERGAAAERELAPPEPAQLSGRWYPVIDYDQCTNCMECMDFCLFGVYGVDHAGTLRTVQQDQCRQDCPACSRVCPVGAIVFPKYQTNQTIAGADDHGDRGNLKLDLSKIFGKPKARHQAALERDRELLKAGRRPASAEKVERLAEEFEKLEL